MIFWFFNALNKNYSTNLNFPVTFDYDEERYLAVSALPGSIRMNVTGSGWDLFRRSTGFKVPPLVVPLEKPAEVRKIVGTTLPAVFAGQLERLKINFIITDTVHLQLEEKEQKKFHVSADSVGRYLHPDYGLADNPEVEPDTIWLEGPKGLISGLPATLQLALPQTNLRKNFNEEIDPLFAGNTLITQHPQKLRVKLTIEKLEEVERQVKLILVNVPSRWKQGGVTNEITCTYRLPASLAKQSQADSLRAVIDLRNKPAGRYKIVPQIIGLPARAVLVKTDTVLLNF